MSFAKALFFCFKAAYKSELLLLNGLAVVSLEGESWWASGKRTSVLY
jgi:hypothetical protein